MKEVYKWMGPAAAVFFVIFFGIWHLFDVRAGVGQTGHGWMYGLYGLLCLFVFLSLGMACFLLIQKKLSLELGAGILTICFGLTALFALPPLSAQIGRASCRERV